MSLHLVPLLVYNILMQICTHYRIKTNDPNSIVVIVWDANNHV